MCIKAAAIALSAISLFICMILPIQACADVAAYSKTRLDTLAAGYTMTVGEAVISIYKNHDKNYARFAMSGTNEVSITAPSAWSGVNIVPSRYNLSPIISDNVLSFSLPEGKRVLICSTGKPDLALFTDPLEVDPPQPTDANVKNVMDFNPDTTGAMVATARLQEAIDWVAANYASKPILYIPDGVYKTGTLKIKDNVQVYLASGACLAGTMSNADYPLAGVSIDYNAIRMFINPTNSRNWKLFGRGILDPRGPQYAQANAHDLMTLWVADCEYFTVDGIMIWNTDYYNLALNRCNYARVNNVKLLCSGEGSNGDGCIVSMGHDDTVTNCYLLNGTDDGFTVGNRDEWPDGCYRIYEENNIVHTNWGSGLRISICQGTGGTHDVTFKNCEVLKMTGGGIYAQAGQWYSCALSIGDVYNIRWENCWIDSRDGIAVLITNEDPDNEFAAPPGQRRDMEIIDCGYNTDIEPGWLSGYAEDNKVRNIHFNNLRRGDAVCANAAEAGLDIGKYTDNITFTVGAVALKPIQNSPQAGMTASPAKDYNLYTLGGRCISTRILNTKAKANSRCSAGIVVRRISGGKAGREAMILVR